MQAASVLLVLYFGRKSLDFTMGKGYNECINHIWQTSLDTLKEGIMKTFTKIVVLVMVCAMLLGLSGCKTEKTEQVKKYAHIDRPSTRGALQVNGGQLCGSDGQPLVLKGVSTHSMPRSESFLNDDCFKEVSEEWGVNVVRLAMYTQANDSYNKSDYFRQKNLELLRKGVKMATDNDMYVIIDWHILDDGDPRQYIAEAQAFFQMISAEYAGYDNIIYELCNEPNGEGVDWPVIKAYAETIIPLIRQNDSNAVIIVGTPNWSQGVDKAAQDPIAEENIMYAFHYYAASHKEGPQRMLKNAVEAGLPVFVTEYGITASNAGFPRDIEEADRWMALLDTYKVSSCIWSFSRAPEAASIFSSNGLKKSDFTDEDLTETGIWFKKMLESYYLGE